MLPDFPEDSKWLTEEERAFVVNRLRSEQGASAVERKTSVKDVANVFKDYKIFLGGFMYFGLIVPAYSYDYPFFLRAQNVLIFLPDMPISRLPSLKAMATDRSRLNFTVYLRGLLPLALLCY